MPTKLTKEQVLTIPTLLQEMSVDEVAKKLNVQKRAIYYWSRKLKAKGHFIPVRKQGRKPLI